MLDTSALNEIRRLVTFENAAILEAVLAEVAWLDAHPTQLRIYSNRYEQLVQEAGLCIQQALRLSKEGA